MGSVPLLLQGNQQGECRCDFAMPQARSPGQGAGPSKALRPQLGGRGSACVSPLCGGI